jgi:hypothetical protein
MIMLLWEEVEADRPIGGLVVIRIRMCAADNQRERYSLERASVKGNRLETDWPATGQQLTIKKTTLIA